MTDDSRSELSGAVNQSSTPPLDRDALREQYARIIDPEAMSLSHKIGRPDVVLTAEIRGRILRALAKADALLALNPPDVKGREVLEQRIADLRTANDVFAEMDRDTSRDRERNEREIEWLTRVIAPMFDNDFSPSDPVLGEKWQAEAEKHLGLAANTRAPGLRAALEKIVAMAAKRRTDHTKCHCTVCEMRDVAEAALASPALSVSVRSVQSTTEQASSGLRSPTSGNR